MALEHEAIRSLGTDLADRFGSRTRRAGGELIVSGAPQFEGARRVYNRLHDPYPLALVRTLEPTLILEVARSCEEFRMPLAVRGGGHHIGGGSGGDGGVVLDFSTFHRVTYCAETQVCRVQPGARLVDIDRELSRYGRVIPTGTVSDTGVAGLTLGGGIGWLAGPLGLTCDYLVGADVLLADGRVVRAEDADPFGLLWALRGGGGAGVALELRFRTVPLPATTTGSVLVGRDIEETLVRLFDYLGSRCPRELTVAPVLSRDRAGRPLLKVEYCAAGDGGRGIADLLDLLSQGVCAPFHGSFVQWQAHIDAEFLPPQRGYWKSCYLHDVSATDVFAMTETISRTPMAHCSILIEHLHGAFADVNEESSAFPLRKARFGVLFAARWPDVEGDRKNIGWVRDSYSRLDPGNSRPVYANYASPQDPRVAASFSAEAQHRLLDLRVRYDFARRARRPGALGPDLHPGAAQ